MRALRVVGITEGSGEIAVVLEDPVRQERFTVSADEQLRAAARGDLTRLGQISIELESQLRPREIQARIRAGASVEQVAAAAGVPAQKIERFAYPVLLERSRTAEVAQRAHPTRPDGPDSRTLGEVVAHTFGLRGQLYADADWDSWKGNDGRWVVALSWRAGRSENRAHWTFQPGAHGGTVAALDEHASDLVEGLPARPLRPVGPVIDIARAEEPEAILDSLPEELRVASSEGARARLVERSRDDLGRSLEPRRHIAPQQRQAPPEPAPWQRVDAGLADDRADDRPANPRREPVTPERPEEPADATPVVDETAGSPDAAPGPTDDRAGAPVDAEPVTASTSDSEVQTPDALGSRATDASATPDAQRDVRAVTTAEPAGTPLSDETAANDETAAGDATTNGTPSGDTASGGTTSGGTVPGDASPSGIAAPVEEKTDRSQVAETSAQTTSQQSTSPQRRDDMPAEDQPPAEQSPTKSAGRRTKKGKPVMPSWDEVLLGVRGQR